MKVDAKTTLQNIKNDNTNAYEHIKKMIVSLALDQNMVQSFEQHSFEARGPPQPEVVFKIRQSFSYIKEFQQKNRALLGKLNTGTPEQPQEPASLNYVPDLVDQSQVFARLGVGFGEDETYRIFKSLCALSLKKNAKQLKLWGKILGTPKDYYIAQGLADGGEDPGQLAPDTEGKGTGVNKWNYWVSTSLTDEWTQLPIVTPQQIKTSRKIKYLFTGDLKKVILTNPIFNGTEAHLLKCQIVRISSSCSIVPKGIYATNADNPLQVQFAENYSFPDVSQMAEKQNWAYFSPGVLKNGRISHIRPEGLEEQEAEKFMKKMLENDPIQPRLKTIALNGENWIVKTVGISETYKTLGKNPKVLSKGIVGIKSLIWPGWTTAGWEGKYTSIYVGYGQKAKFTYFPREPEPVLQECPEREEVVMK